MTSLQQSTGVSVTFGSKRWQGPAIDLRERDIGVAAVATAVTTGDTAVSDRQLTVECPDPSPVHERVGVVTPDRQYELRAALAAVGRERGYETPVDAELAAVERELDEIDQTEIELASLKRELEAIEHDEHKERVATLRGRVQALSERNADASEARETLQAAISELSAAGTEKIAAKQALDAARTELRAERDRRERRLRLQDRRANLRRTAREHLAAQLQPAYERARAAVSTEPSENASQASRSTDATTALAVCRLANISAPIVLGTDHFPTPTAAAEALGGPVVLVQ